MATYVLTYNPDRWTWPEDDRARAIAFTQRGGTFADRWSTGVRTSGIAPGERAVLLRQGRGQRGLIARGTFTSSVERGPHWDGSQGQANFASLVWDLVLDDADVIPIAELLESVPGVAWNGMQGSGVRVPDASESALDELWERFGYPPVPDGQGRQDDPVRRRLVEDHAQRLLEDHFRSEDWDVVDTRYGNPFDAIATKANETRYLEAKGTETDGISVLVTSGEVDWARQHRGECILGIVSGIRFDGDGLDPDSGELTLHDWDPDAGTLRAKSYQWQPGREA